MRHMSVIAIAALVSALSACTFVHMAPGATKVKVLASAPTSCTKRGEVEVSVKDRLGPYERSESQVRDELETLARNEAAGIPANTVQPLGDPADGAQRFAAYQCSRR